MTQPATLNPVALVADDEPLLLEGLVSDLESVWPELEVKHTVTSGQAAVESLLSHRVDVAFLDIRMSGATGLEVAQAVAEEWPEHGANVPAPPLIVFVTAYEEHALQAFKLAAVDYVLKPITRDRLTDTIERLKARLAERQVSDSLSTLTQQVSMLIAENQTPKKPELLKSVRGSVGDTIHIIPIAEVILFEASEKYLVVHSKDREIVIRESLRSLLPQLDPGDFAQIHRKSIVNLNYVKSATRLENGKLQLELNHCGETPIVSRLYRHLFQAM